MAGSETQLVSRKDDAVIETITDLSNALLAIGAVLIASAIACAFFKHRKPNRGNVRKAPAQIGVAA